MTFYRGVLVIAVLGSLSAASAEELHRPSREDLVSFKCVSRRAKDEFHLKTNFQGTWFERNGAECLLAFDRARPLAAVRSTVYRAWRGYEEICDLAVDGGERAFRSIEIPDSLHSDAMGAINASNLHVVKLGRIDRNTFSYQCERAETE